jgi:cytochrome c peroxidase
MACASCHVPSLAFGPPDAQAVQPGGPDMRQVGHRAVPGLRYLQAVPQFVEHYFDSDDEGDDSVDNGPTGGLTWDGRVDRGADQARLPLLSPVEMANESPAAVVAKAKAGYGAELTEIFGPTLFDDGARAFKAVLKAFEVYEQDYRDFYPYSSRYDAWLAGTAGLSPQEQRGLALFEDPDKGNCAECHLSKRAKDGTPPQFTDYGLIAVGVPRNPAIPANADPAFHDLGVCGPDRTDLAGHLDYCGLFKTPTLRNVALRKVFFHNGRFTNLRDAVAFYASRDTNPERWYPRRPDGTVAKFDDLPPPYHANLNTDPPFDRNLGDPPALTDAEVDDIMAFLQTLTDADVLPKQPATGP